ncbi:MAG: FHA domain-containing protein [bacterium]
MDIALGTLLLIGKWALIALVYAILFIVLRTVRREMAQRLDAPPLGSAVAGYLRVVAGGSDPRLNSGRIIPLPNVMLVGADESRLEDNDLLIKDDFVSGLHARLSWDGAHWWVEDLDSTNGTFIDERRLAPYERVAAPAGSTVQFGDATFILTE